MPTFRITAPDGATYEVTGPEGATEQDALAQVQAQLGKPKADPLAEARAQQMSEMSGPQKFLAAMGKAPSDLYLGARQILGNTKPGEVEERRRLEKPLLNTGAGMAGNITGSVATLAPALVVPGANTVAGAGVVGALSGAMQPTAGDESRLANAAIGGTVGAGAQYGIGKLLGAAGDRLAAKQASEATRQSVNAVKDTTLRASQEAGYVVPPSMADGNLPGRLLEGLSGKYKTNQLAAIKNQNVTDTLAKKALGLPADQPITPEALKTIRADAFERGYAPVAAAGRIETDSAYRAALDKIVSKYEGAGKDFPGVASADVPKFVNGKANVEIPQKPAWLDDSGRVVEDFVEPKAPKMRSLLEDIKKAGGISPKEVADLGVYDIHRTNPGLLNKKAGQSADGLVEILEQRGWITAAQKDAAEQMPGGAQELAKDMVRSALNRERVIHPADEGKWFSYSDSMQAMTDAGIKKGTIPDTSSLVGGMRVKNFDAGNGIKMTQILRDEANAAFRAGDTGLGKAKKDAAKAIEDQIERGLMKLGQNGKELLANFREARTLMAKSHNVESALVAEGGKVNAKVLGAALQKGKPLTDELRTIGAFANNFKDVAGVPKSGWANPLTVLDMAGGTFGGLPGQALAGARVASRYGLLSDIGQKTLAKPRYGPSAAEKLSPEVLAFLEKYGAGGVVGAGYAGKQ